MMNGFPMVRMRFIIGQKVGCLLRRGDRSFARLIIHDQVRYGMTNKVYLVSLFFLIIGIGSYFFKDHADFFSRMHRVQTVDFDESMLLTDFPHILDRNDFKVVYGIFKDLYEKHNFKTLAASKDARIPKLIHVMWLGGKLPQEFESY